MIIHKNLQKKLNLVDKLEEKISEMDMNNRERNGM